MIIHNFDPEFAWKHIQSGSTQSLIMAYRDKFDLNIRIAKNGDRIYVALEDMLEIISKEYVFDLADLKVAFDKYIIIMRERE